MEYRSRAWLRLAVLGGSAALLMGCQSVRDAAGMNKQAPDEFAVVTKQPLIIHEFIKRLHRRYQSEGVSFQSPAETIVYAEAPAGMKEYDNVADALIEGSPPTPEQRAKGEQRVVRAGRDYAAGSSTMVPINPVWDNQLLDHLERGDLAAFDSWTVEEMAKEGGGSAHEVRTWIAAHASLAAAGPYDMTSRFYEAIPAWIAGFAVTTAQER